MSKILIIEDEEPIRRVLVRILSDEDSGFEIQEASDGKKRYRPNQKRIF
jgi:two-component system nitrogen regulation response regulator NtrX